MPIGSNQKHNILKHQKENTIRKKRKSYNIEGHAHELTFSCYFQYKYLANHTSCSIFLEELAAARAQLHFYMWAYVLMPTHVHLLIFPTNKTYNTSIILQSIKGKMSTKYRNYLKEHNPVLFEKMCLEIKGRQTFRFWQAGGGYDRNMWAGKAIANSIRYIEENPVRAEFVQKPTEWQWSSAHARMLKKGLIPDQTGIPVIMN